MLSNPSHFGAFQTEAEGRSASDGLRLQGAALRAHYGFSMENHGSVFQIGRKAKLCLAFLD